MNNPNIIYNKILGYAIMQIGDDIHAEPIVNDHNGKTLIELVDIADSKSLTIIPAIEDYVVHGKMPDGFLQYLGEHHGGKSYNPNWEDILNKKIAIWKKNNIDGE